MHPDQPGDQPSDQPHELRRVIPDPGFAGDDGAAAPEVTTALAAFDETAPGAHQRVLSVLQDARVLVPVVAMLGEVEVDENGLAREKTSDMATVLVTGADGRLGLLAFTGSDRMAAWNPDGRPVPVSLRLAAASALQDGAEAIVLDLAGPVLFAIEADDLRSLAAGHRLVEIGGRWGWVAGEVS